MGEAFITRRGGNGGGQNFRVIGAASQPSNPKENDIWVKTSTPILTEQVFFNEAVGSFWTGGGDGSVYITFTASSSSLQSTTGMNVLVKKGIYSEMNINLTKCQQLINGSWKSMDAYIYHASSGWNQFSTSIYWIYSESDGWQNGITFTASAKAANSSQVSNKQAPSISTGASGAGTSIIFNQVSGKNGVYMYGATVPTSQFSNIHLTMSCTNTVSGTNSGFFVWSANGTYFLDNVVLRTINTADSVLDISGVGTDCYIGFGAYSQVRYVIYNIWMD